MHIIHFDTIDSTNAWLRLYVGELDHATVVETDFQTAGKGQATNKWESENGKNLLFSLLLEPTKIPISQQFLLSELVAVSMADVLSETLQTDVRIKWPNDIYVADCKLSGILIETILSGNVMAKAIVGIGLNVNQERFVSDAPNPISMARIAQKSFDRTEILTKIVGKIVENYNQFDVKTDMESLQTRYFSKLYRNSGFHTFALPSGEKFSAKIAKIEPTGQMILQNEKGETRSFAFKEVAFVL